MGNGRGTEYSAGHTEMTNPADFDPEKFWNYSMDGLALDVNANVKAMYDNADNGKGWYIGHSQGSS